MVTLLADKEAVSNPLPHQLPENRGRYSLFRAFRSALEHQETSPRIGFEAEVSQELARRSGRRPRGFLVPLDLQVRSLSLTTGAGAIPTILPSGMFVDALRAKSVLGQLGAIIANLSPGEAGQVAIPKKSAAATVSWVGDGGAPGSESNPVFDQQVVFQAHTVTAFTDLTRKMWRSGTPDLEGWIWDDLATDMGIELDRVGLNGSGASNQPTGILANGSVPVYPLGTNGGAIQRTDLVALEAAVGNANADAAAGSRLGFVTTPNGRSKLRRTDVNGASGTSGRFVWKDDNTMIGYPSYATSNMPSAGTKGTGTNLSSLIYGNFADIIINLFTFVDILPNPYLQTTTGNLRFSSFLDADVQLRHPESFQNVVDMITT